MILKIGLTLICIAWLCGFAKLLYEAVLAKSGRITEILKTLGFAMGILGMSAMVLWTAIQIWVIDWSLYF